MIPRRIPSHEINGLRERVTACRKRLRVNRIHRAHVDNQPDEPFRETKVAASKFSEYSENLPAVREFLVHLRDGETSEQFDGQEVGTS
ncbi:MAG: hypothetical protein ABI923_06495 [bacterium]